MNEDPASLSFAPRSSALDSSTRTITRAAALPAAPMASPMSNDIRTQLSVDARVAG
jgi:hypothetical protein